jgi:hypothetical protein
MQLLWIESKRSKEIKRDRLWQQKREFVRALQNEVLRGVQSHWEPPIALEVIELKKRFLKVFLEKHQQELDVLRQRRGHRSKSKFWQWIDRVLAKLGKTHWGVRGAKLSGKLHFFAREAAREAAIVNSKLDNSMRLMISKETLADDFLTATRYATLKYRTATVEAALQDANLFFELAKNSAVRYQTAHQNQAPHSQHEMACHPAYWFSLMLAELTPEELEVYNSKLEALFRKNNKHKKKNTLSRKEHNQHPYARRIPYDLFSTFFNDGELFTPDIVSLMASRAPLTDLSQDRLRFRQFSSNSRETAAFNRLSFLKIHQDRHSMDQLKACLWLAIVFSHPKLSVEELKTLSNKLQLSNDTLLTIIRSQYYCLIGESIARDNPSLLEYLKPYMTQAEWLEMIQANNCYAFQWAAENGQLQALQYLATLVTPSELRKMIQADNYGAFREAAKNGHLNVLKYLTTLVEPSELRKMLLSNNNAPFEKAVEWHRPTVVKHLLSFPDVFEWVADEVIEANFEHPHTSHLDNFVQKKITPLLKFEYAFNVNHKEAKLLLRIVDYLIQRNKTESNEWIAPLLSIENVKTLAKQNNDLMNHFIDAAQEAGNLKAAAALRQLKALGLH